MCHCSRTEYNVYCYIFGLLPKAIEFEGSSYTMHFNCFVSSSHIELLPSTTICLSFISMRVTILMDCFGFIVTWCQEYILRINCLYIKANVNINCPFAMLLNYVDITG